MGKKERRRAFPPRPERRDSTPDTQMNWITTPEQLEDFADDLLSEPEIAIDTESNGFYGYFRSLSLVQVATSSEVALLDVQALPKSAWETFQPLLDDPHISVVMHGASNDLSGMKRELGLDVRSLFDTQLAACYLSLPSRGLDKLLSEHFGVSSSKKFQRFDWSIRPLPADALHYAAQDAEFLLPLKARLLEMLQDSPFLEAVMQESEAMTQREVEPYSYDRESFRKVKGAKELHRRELAVLKELHLWRHEVCSELDRAEFLVCNDGGLMQLVRRRPSNFRQLEKIRAINPKQRERYGEEILAAVERGMRADELPPSRPPKKKRKGPKLPPRNNDVYDRLRAWRAVRAEQLSLENGLLISNKTLEAIARWLPKTLEQLEAMSGWLPWRTEFFADDVLKVVRLHR
jgi:ribonuclease D